MRDKILIVDENQTIRRTLAYCLNEQGFSLVETGTATDAITIFNKEHPDAVLLDINLSNGASLEVLREIKGHLPDTVVIMIAANLLSDEIFAALRSGADDFIVQPINLKELEARIRNGIEKKSLHRKVNSMPREKPKDFGFDRIIGCSPAMKEMLRLAHKVAESEVSCVLLQGESGTGKDCVAKAIHNTSIRAHHPFVAINCAALPSNLIESELFGYEKSAFTDARMRKEGLLEQADGGTIYLDEIGELDINLQAKLLRALEEKVFRRVGGLKDVNFSARVIAASNRDLKKDVKAGLFRLDLYYRLAVIQIDIPPLRERGDDVLLLARHFIDSFSNRLGKRHICKLTAEVARDFRQYEWLGNVRELRNTIERAMIFEDGNMITRHYLPRGIAADTVPDACSAKSAKITDNGTSVQFPREGISLDKVEKSFLKQALARSNGNVTRAARLLGITRDTLRYRLKKHGETINDVMKTGLTRVI